VGLSPALGSKILRSPDIDKDTRLLSPLHVAPTCWWLTPDPTVHVWTALRASASPGKRVSGMNEYIKVIKAYKV